MMDIVPIIVGIASNEYKDAFNHPGLQNKVPSGGKRSIPGCWVMLAGI